MKNILSSFLVFCTVFTFGACSDHNEQAAVYLAVSCNELSFAADAETQTIKVEATRRWNAVASGSWITVTPDGYPSAGEHFPVNVAVTVSRNDNGKPREGTLTFYLGDEAAAEVTVIQDIENGNDRPVEEEFPVTWANLEWAAATVIPAGGIFEAGCCVFADGVTNTLESNTGEAITCDIGYSTSDSRPDGDDWTWSACWFNGDWGDNFYYQGRIENALPAGVYYYTFRIRNADGPYKYAGTNGLWDGVENVNGAFTAE